MNSKKIINLMLSSSLIALALISFFLYQVMAISNNLKIPYIVIIAVLIGYFVYSLKRVITEYNILRMDKKNGVEEAVLEFVAISTKPNLDIKYPKFNIPVATFKSPITNEFIGLSGDYSRIKFVIGKKYKVSFFRYSKSLVDIRDAYRKEI